MNYDKKTKIDIFKNGHVVDFPLLLIFSIIFLTHKKTFGNAKKRSHFAQNLKIKCIDNFNIVMRMLFFYEHNYETIIVVCYC